MRSVLLILSAALAIASAQKDPNFAEGHNTIVHLFEWTWEDIANECENFLGPKGYGGVQISPPNENVIVETRPWWERYQPVSYNLTTRSGDATALADMIKRCNAVGVRVYPDAVFNHMAAMNDTGTAGNHDYPDVKSYPAVPYDNDNFHETCQVGNYQDASNIRNCELVGLPDLDQSQDHVREKIIDYLNTLVDMGVAGFRVDAAKHMWPEDLEYIYSSVHDLNTDHGFAAGSRPYYYQEVIDFGGQAVTASEYIDFGVVVEFRYGDQMGRVFAEGDSLGTLYDLQSNWNTLNGSDCIVMLDNHDTQRANQDNIVTYKRPKAYRAGAAFMIGHNFASNSKIMSSYEFEFSDTSQGPPNNDEVIIGPGTNYDGDCENGWVCEHRWRQIYNMVKFRSVVSGTDLNNWWGNGDNQIAFTRGDKGFMVFSKNSGLEASIPTGMAAGTYCDVISGDLVDGACTGKSVTIDSSGNAAVSLAEDDEDFVIAIHVESKLA